jgi:hypothetical protein
MNDVLAKYSYNGDANFDGRINFDDYFRIDTGYLAQPAKPTYAQGDFNYDGKINFDDYFLIDQSYLGQGQPLEAAPLAAAPAAGTAVSEEERRKPVRRTDRTPPLFSTASIRSVARRTR